MKRYLFLFLLASISLLSLPTLSIHLVMAPSEEYRIGRFYYGAGDDGSSTAQEIAEIYDMSSDYHAKDKAFFDQVKTYNPAFKRLMYWNPAGIDHNPSRPNPLWTKYVSNRWLLKDSSGAYIHDNYSPNLWMVDIGNPSYQRFIANLIANGLNDSGYEGLFADVSFLILANQYNSDKSGIAINPRTGKVWTDLEVRTTQLKLQKAIKSKIGSKLMICNGINAGGRFWRNFEAYEWMFANTPVDGVICENIWSTKGTEWMTVKQWSDSLQMLMWLQDNWLSGHPQRCLICSSIAGLDPKDPNHWPIPLGATSEQLLSYNICSTMLGISTSQVYCTSKVQAETWGTFAIPLLNTDLGAPIGTYYKVGSYDLYARDFANVRVYLNPSSVEYKVDGITIRPYWGLIVTT